MTREQALRYAAWEAADLSRQGYPQGARARELLAANRPGEAIRLMRSIHQDAADGLTVALEALEAGEPRCVREWALRLVPLEEK